MSLGKTAGPEAAKGLFYSQAQAIDVSALTDSMQNVLVAPELQNIAPVREALTVVATKVANGVFEARIFPQEENKGVMQQEMTNTMLTAHLAMVTESMRLTRRIDLGLASVLGERPTGVKAKRVAKESTGAYLSAYRDRCQLFGVDSINSGVPTDTDSLKQC